MANNKADIKPKPAIDLPPIVFMRPDFPQGFSRPNTDVRPRNKVISPKKGNNMAIVVSKKNFKTAVARNKAKRLIKEALRVAAKEENIPLEGISLKINAQKPILDVQFQRLVELIKKAIKK